MTVANDYWVLNTKDGSKHLIHLILPTTLQYRLPLLVAFASIDVTHQVQ